MDPSGRSMSVYNNIRMDPYATIRAFPFTALGTRELRVENNHRSVRANLGYPFAYHSGSFERIAGQYYSVGATPQPSSTSTPASTPESTPASTSESTPTAAPVTPTAAPCPPCPTPAPTPGPSGGQCKTGADCKDTKLPYCNPSGKCVQCIYKEHCSGGIELCTPAGVCLLKLSPQCIE